MSGKNWEAEDGMGFAGMVPTLAEKRQDEYEQRQRDRMRTLESQVSTLQATNTTLQRELEGKTRLAQLGIDSTARRNKEIAELKATNAGLRQALQSIQIEVQQNLRGQVAKTIFDLTDSALAASAGERTDDEEPLTDSQGRDLTNASHGVRFP
jgi:chromosome segregation ATPase